MPGDLQALLERTASEPTEPLDVDAVIRRGGRRRTRRRVVQGIGGIAAVLVVVLGATQLSADDGGSGGAVTADSAPGTASTVETDPTPETGVTPDTTATSVVPSHLVQVPDLLGLAAEEAEDLAEDAGFTTSVDLVVTAEVEPGRVVGTDPAPGTTLVDGDHLRIQVADAGRSVPDVRGLHEADALAALTEAGLGWGATEWVASTEVEPAHVLATTPAAGEVVAPGTDVVLLVAQRIDDGEVVLPDVTHLPPDDAVATLQALGVAAFEWARPILGAPVGVVLETSPPAGMVVALGADVGVVVSTGVPRVTVPYVVHLSEQRARFALEEVGLEVEVVEQVVDDPSRVGRVVEQSPASGTEVDAGSTVQLTVGRTADGP
jgi:beta-lactam-binding protein with PASTA domain